MDMSLLKWFEGDSKAALQQMIDRNCAFLIYIGNGNDELTNIFDDANIIQLLNNDLILCYKMDPLSPSFKNFKDIFNNVVIPSIYLLEKNNTQQYTINITKHLMNHHDIEKDLKFQMLNAIYCIIKNISDSINDGGIKQKYLQYLTDINKKDDMFTFIHNTCLTDIFLTEILQLFNNLNINTLVKKVAEEIKQPNSTTKIKFKVPSKNITIVEEFLTTSSLSNLKTFISNKENLPERHIKLIAHRQFIDEDFNQTLYALNLCPSSTIYVHIVENSNQWLYSILNYQSWLGNVFNFTVLYPFNLMQNFLMSFVRPSPPVEASRMINRRNKPPTVKKSTYKRFSNIHQLKNSDSDDDENNTYNGNSTQQL